MRSTPASSMIRKCFGWGGLRLERTLVFRDDRLAVSMRELQKDTWQKLHTFKAQLKLVLEEVEKQVLGSGKAWTYILDFLLNRPTDPTFLEVLNLAKTVLKHYKCVRGHRVGGPVR